MGLFGFLRNKTGSKLPSEEKKPTSSVYDVAIKLINSKSDEDQLLGRKMMVNETRDKPSSQIDPRIFMWMAEDYEAHACYRTAAQYYKKALEAGLSEAEEPLKRCDNPYNTDNLFYSILPVEQTKICGTPLFNRIQSIKDSHQKELDQAIEVLNGDPSPSEREESLKTIRLLATARSCVVPYAKTFLGDLCLRDKKDKEAAKWYREAADNEDPVGTRRYAEMLARGCGVEQNLEESIRYYEIAADIGDAPSQYRMGEYFENRGEEKKAKDYYQRAEKNGYSIASEKVREMSLKIKNDKDGKYAKQFQEQSEAVVAKYKAILKENDIEGECIQEIFQPDDFCEKLYHHCIQRSGTDDIQHLSDEQCIRSYYGCICAVALWHRDRSFFEGKTVWETLNTLKCVDMADIIAEDLLNKEIESIKSALPEKIRKRGNGKRAKRLSKVLSEYKSATEAFVLEDYAQGQISLFVMKQAFCLGMRIATTEIEMGKLAVEAESANKEKHDQEHNRTTSCEGANTGSTQDVKPKKNSSSKEILALANTISSKSALPPLNEKDSLITIFQPDDFCRKAYQYCKRQYGGDAPQKLSLELCKTSYYGCICSSVFWHQDHSFAEDGEKSVWDALYETINVEFTENNAERLLKTKQGEEKAERIYRIIGEYIEQVMPIFLQSNNEGELCMFAMKQAYILGMRVAKEELESIKSEESSAPQQNNSWGSNDDEGSEPIQAFYANCVEDFHNAAKSRGMANRGLIFIPELIPIGEKTVLAFLKDPFFQMQFSGNPQMYYYAIMSLSLQAGIVFAVKWHDNFSALKAGYVDQIIEEGPADACKPFLRQLGLTNNDKENDFYRAIYARWLAKHEPYWKMNDPRDYTFKATLAAYQLGISMILEKYGY